MDLLALLFVLGVCGSLASENGVKSAPEDFDSSGDDDFSGSGIDTDDSEETDALTEISSLVPTVTQWSTTQKPDIAVEKETEEEAVTKHTQTTKADNLIEDVFGVHMVSKEPSVNDTTLEPTTHQMSIVESVDDVKKHHHHTTTPVTSLSTKSDVVHVTTIGTPDVEKPLVPAETTTSTPDEGDYFIQEVTQTPEGSVQHVPSETTSGLTSTLESEETTAGIDEVPGFVDSVDESTVTDETHTHKPHHHHHHHHHTTTAIPGNGSDLFEVTKLPDHFEPEENLHHQGEVTTTPPSEDKRHVHHHHTTTPGATTEQFIVHTQEAKGRRINVPPAETTVGVSVVSEDEELLGSTVRHNNSVTLIQDEDTGDSTEEGSGNGPVTETDLFFEKVTVGNVDRMAPVPGDGSSGASHGIMERTELLAGIIAGGLAGLVFAASLVAFVFYRMKKKDEGSYSLEEPKQSNGGYQKPREQREFYA